jgi:UDP-glucose 4-epimerase
MKILVTGGAGFIGSHVVDAYLEEGHDVVVIDDLSTGRLSNLDPRAKFYQLNICDPAVEEIFREEQPDILNHHAAQMDVRYSVAHPLFDAEVNILGSLRLIDLARQYQVKRVIYISSGGAVYGEPQYLPCDEAHPVDPICPYGASKHTVEHYLFLYENNYGLAYTVLRYPNVYGPRQNPAGEAGVVAIFAGRLLSGEMAVISGDGEQLRDYVFVKDCAWANVLALAPDLPSGIFNLGSGEGTSVNTLFCTLKMLTGSQQDEVHGPAKLGETRHIYLDAKKAVDVLGWKQRVSLEDGLAETVEYIRSKEARAGQGRDPISGPGVELTA